MIQITKSSVSEDPSLRGSVNSAREELWKNPTGYLQLPEREALWQVSQETAEKLTKKYSHLAVIGMGGSSLGAKALIEAVGDADKVSFFLDTDPESYEKQINKLDINNTHWLVVSKSGGTLEVLVLVNYITAFLNSKGLQFNDHCTVITEPKESVIKNWATENNIPTIDHPMDVGGRFSVLSPVGMLPCAFAGVNINEIKKGAIWLKKNPEIVEQFATQTLQSFKREEFVSLFWFYSMGLESFGLWLNQLWAESLGKAKNLQGDKAPRVSTPYTCTGARDQHSVLQQIAEGYKDKFVSFFQIKNFKSQLTLEVVNQFAAKPYLETNSMAEVYQTQSQSTSSALEKEGVNQLYFEIDKLDAKSLGAMALFFEATIGVLGPVLGIDPYDQPGVEAGKIIAVEKLTTKN